jgi:hypothetical protein
MNALAQNPLFWGGLITGLLVVYLLPSLIGAIRHVEGLGWLVAFNVLIPGIGWLAGTVQLARRRLIIDAALNLSWPRVGL